MPRHWLPVQLRAFPFPGQPTQYPHFDIFIFFVFKEKLSDAMGDDDVIVLGGNSPAFRSIVISLTIFLGALIGAVILYEMVVFFYQRVATKNRIEDLESEGGNEQSL